MDEITVYGGTFEECLIDLETVLHRCKTREISNFWKKGKIVISIKNPKFIL